MTLKSPEKGSSSFLSVSRPMTEYTIHVGIFWFKHWVKATSAKWTEQLWAQTFSCTYMQCLIEYYKIWTLSVTHPCTSIQQGDLLWIARYCYYMISLLLFHGLSVRLSVTLELCAQMAEDIVTNSFTYNSPMSLLCHVKIWLTVLSQFLFKILCKSGPPPCSFDSWRHLMANCGPVVRFSVIFTIETPVWILLLAFCRGYLILWELF